MGLLDSILGNMMGAGGSPAQTRSSATSPMVKALMLLLAAKAYQHYTSRPQGGSTASGGGLGGMLGGQAGGGLGGMLGGGQGGGLGGMLGGQGGLGGMLGGLLGGLAGGGASSGLGGGLGGLLDQIRRNGYGEHADSWVSTGQNRYLPPNELAQALGPDTIDELEQQTGLPRDELLSELSRELPDAVDQFTPDGRLPSEQEVAERFRSGPT